MWIQSLRVLGDGDKGHICCDSSNVTYCASGDWYIMKGKEFGHQKTLETEPRKKYSSLWKM